MIKVYNLHISNDCPKTSTGNHVITYEGQGIFWCKQCGKLFHPIGDEYGDYDLKTKDK